MAIFYFDLIIFKKYWGHDLKTSTTINASASIVNVGSS